MELDAVFERRTLFIMITGGLAASVLVFTSLTDNFYAWVMYRSMFVADAMFHEMGHAVFDWAFGMPALPSIFTLFGSDQAAGVTIALDRSWSMQVISFAAMACGCYWVKCNYPSYLRGAIGMALVIAALAFTRYYRVVVLYMGHGSSIFMGGFLLFRAWEYTYTRTGYQRWMNGFFGFYLVFHNLHLAWKLATDALSRQEYSSPTFDGAVDNDFVQIADLVWSWSVQGIAEFTVAYCVLALIVPVFLACCLKEDDSL